MRDNWYEVWADEGLPHPYLLLVLPLAGGGATVFDPKEGKVVYQATSYDEARLWLLEDDYTRVEGKMARSGEQ